MPPDDETLRILANISTTARKMNLVSNPDGLPQRLYDVRCEAIGESGTCVIQCEATNEREASEASVKLLDDATEGGRWKAVLVLDLGPAPTVSESD